MARKSKDAEEIGEPKMSAKAERREEAKEHGTKKFARGGIVEPSTTSPRPGHVGPGVASGIRDYAK